MERGIEYMERYEAIGLIETFGLVFVLEAADAMCKAADVELIGYENVASGLRLWRPWEQRYTAR